MATNSSDTSRALVALGARNHHDAAVGRFVPEAQVRACRTYRDAVLLAWDHRSRKSLTRRALAEECGLYAPHVSSYLHPDPLDAKSCPRLDLPADCIEAFEEAVSNHAIRQYLNYLGRLTM